MVVKPLVVSVLALMACSVQAAGLDRSGQSILPFLQSGNYLELGVSYLSPEVAGKDTTGKAVPEMAEDYHFVTGAVKADINEQFQIGVLYDQPYGAAATYTGQNNFVSANNSYTLPGSPNPIPNAAIGITGATSVDVTSHNLTALLGFKPMPSVMVYAGPAAESIQGRVQLRGPAYSVLNGYTAEMNEDSSVGYVAGFAFEKPEIALKFALTYRSEIEHKLRAQESIALPDAAALTLAGVEQQLTGVNAQLGLVNAGLQQVQAGLQQDPTNAALLAQQQTLQGQQAQLQAGKTQLEGAKPRLQGLAAFPSSLNSDTKITTPQSVNLDFQTGIMKDTLAFANVRWVNWSKFAIKPNLFGAATGLQVAGGLNIVDYTDDQWSATVGVGRKLTPQVAGSVSVGWDSGAGNPITTLGPTEGYWNVGVGVRYSPVKDVDVSLGAKYFWLGDADAKLSSGTVVGTFEDNQALALGLKLGYRF